MADPAGEEITGWVQNKANELLAAKLAGVKRVSSGRHGGRYNALSRLSATIYR